MKPYIPTSEEKTRILTQLFCAILAVDGKDENGNLVRFDIIAHAAEDAELEILDRVGRWDDRDAQFSEESESSTNVGVES